jgi:hypothetical protein
MSALRNPFRKTTKTVSKAMTTPRGVGRPLDDSTHRIKKIVLTGGPCGGKSSGMSHISEFLRGLTGCVPFLFRG